MAVSTAIDLSAVARVLGIKTEFLDLRAGQVTFLPQRVVLLGQGSTSAVYDLTKRQITSALQAGQIYGFGSPIHLAAMELLPATGGGLGTVPLTVLPLDDAGAGVAATGDISGAGAQVNAAAYRVSINNILSNEFVISAGDAFTDVATAVADAINAILEMPVSAVNNAGTVELTSKWAGTSANAINVEIVGESDGITFAITQPAGGLVNPTTAEIDAALAQIGDVWETMGISCFESTDTTIIDQLETFGAGRWGALTRKPMVWFMASTETDVATAGAVADANKTYFSVSQLDAPGSNDLPFVVSGAQVAQIAPQANNNPPVDYGSTPVSSIVPGTDGEQWTYAQRDQAVKLGISTIEIKDGVLNLSDIVTFYHPEGDTTPAYRYVVDIVKLQNILFNVDIIFAGKPWDGAPLIPNDQPTVNPEAKKPKDAKAALATLSDNLGLQAIISDPQNSKDATVAEINGQNPKRLDVCYPVKVSGNANIISIDLKFAFFFGS